MQKTPMRRQDRALDTATSIEVLQQASYGILATCVDNEPLATPLNFALEEEPLAIIFHCAPEGQKLNNLKQNPQACFTVIDRVKILPQEFSTAYHSVMAFGEAQLVTNPEDKIACLLKIAQKYSPEYLDSAKEYIYSALDKLVVMRLTIEHFTGKRQV